MMHGQKKY